MENQELNNVLSKLENVRRNRNQFTARCPIHGDHRNSLSIGAADDGRVLIFCFAGCDTKEILAAVGLEMKDLFPSKR